MLFCLLIDDISLVDEIGKYLKLIIKSVDFESEIL